MRDFGLQTKKDKKLHGSSQFTNRLMLLITLFNGKFLSTDYKNILIWLVWTNCMYILWYVVLVIWQIYLNKLRCMLYSKDGLLNCAEQLAIWNNFSIPSRQQLTTHSCITYRPNGRTIYEPQITTITKQLREFLVQRVLQDARFRLQIRE